MEEFQVLKTCFPKHAARMLIYSPTMCGKMLFIQDLLLDKHTPYEAAYIWANWLDQQPYREIIETLTARGVPVSTYTSIPEERIEFDYSKRNSFVDDLIKEAEKSHYMGHLLRDALHHDKAL